MPRLLLIAVLALAGCAHGPSDKAPGCSGAKRAANPYGSVLTPAAQPGPDVVGARAAGPLDCQTGAAS